MLSHLILAAIAAKLASASFVGCFAQLSEPNVQGRPIPKQECETYCSGNNPGGYAVIGPDPQMGYQNDCFCVQQYPPYSQREDCGGDSYSYYESTPWRTWGCIDPGNWNVNPQDVVAQTQVNNPKDGINFCSQLENNPQPALWTIAEPQGYNYQILCVTELPNGVGPQGCRQNSYIVYRSPNE